MIICRFLTVTTKLLLVFVIGREHHVLLTHTHKYLENVYFSSTVFHNSHELVSRFPEMNKLAFRRGTTEFHQCCVTFHIKLNASTLKCFL